MGYRSSTVGVCMYVYIRIYNTHLYTILSYSLMCSCVLCTLTCAGTVMLNPNVEDSPSIVIQYPEFPEGIATYPDMAKILELASKEISLVS